MRESPLPCVSILWAVLDVACCFAAPAHHLPNQIHSDEHMGGGTLKGKSSSNFKTLLNFHVCEPECKISPSSLCKHPSS